MRTILHYWLCVLTIVMNSGSVLTAYIVGQNVAYKSDVEPAQQASRRSGGKPRAITSLVWSVLSLILIVQIFGLSEPEVLLFPLPHLVNAARPTASARSQWSRKSLSSNRSIGAGSSHKTSSSPLAQSRFVARGARPTGGGSSWTAKRKRSRGRPSSWQSRAI